jgi:hypothetical protein
VTTIDKYVFMTLTSTISSRLRQLLKFSILLLLEANSILSVRNFLFSLLTILISCNQQAAYLPHPSVYPINDKFFSGKVEVQMLTSIQGFKVLLKDSLDHAIDQIIFKYVPYQFDTADVNHDGRTEILIGLIKATEFDPHEKKRLFILRVDNRQLRPLWLGSKVCQELIDFRSLDNGIVQTIERTAKDTYAIGDYYWESFGLTLRNYTHTEISLNEALQIFQHAN